MNFRRLLGLLAVAVLVAGTPAHADPAPVAAAPAAFPDAFDDPLDVPLPDPDLWQRIRLGFALEPLDTPLVHEHEAWYASRPEYIKRFVDRGSLYLHHIVGEVGKRGMPMEIALLPVVESAFNPAAYSRAKAAGLWQFIPSTGKNYGLGQDWWRDNRRDVVAATDAALNYLQRLHEMFGSWELALAAYNCGEGCVGRAIAANQRKGLATDYLSLKLPPETRHYVPKLFAVKNIVLSPATYGIELDSVPDQPYFTTVPAPARIDVRLAAKLAGMSEEEFIALNPAHTKPVAVAQAGTLVLPLDKAATFRENLEAWDQPLVSWTTYPAKKGESLDAIARRHGVSATELRSVNSPIRLDKKGRLRVAQPVLVPLRPAPGAAQLVKASGTAPAPSAPAPKPEAPRWYTVRAGDTLYGIALRFESELEELLDLNRLTARAVIHPGLKLRIP